MKRALLCLLAVLMLNCFPLSLLAQMNAVPPLMNYQGRLARPDGTPVADGNVNLQFSLFDSLTGGTLLWQRSAFNVPVRKGTFAAPLDFSSGYQSGATPSTLFGASAVFLQISINGGAPLSPRQQLASVAYAMKANAVPDGAITTSSLANGAVTGAKIANGTITADKLAGDAFNLQGWLLTGNSGTNPAIHFLGTTDNQPLLFKVNSQRALQIQHVQNGVHLGNNLLGGYWLNSITSGVTQATVFGGGKFDNTEYPNRVTDHAGTISGGIGNRAGNDNAGLLDAGYATVGGGYGNTASGFTATVGGGQNNIASNSYATVGGGFGNTASYLAATVGGGYSNTASSDSATVGGGILNTANYAAMVGGGYNNTASGDYSTVAGGAGNTASGVYATVAGGASNTAAGNYSFAAGFRAKANHTGAFVWADSPDADFASTNVNQFLIRASGGVGINTNDPQGNALNVAGTIQMTGFKLPAGASSGAVLTSNASGIGTWVNSASLFGTPAAASSYHVWGLSGNSGTNPASHFLGTTDNQPLVLKANNQRALQMEYVQSGDYLGINVLGGFWLNSISSDVTQATVFGGGKIGDYEYPNRVTDRGGTVSGGIGNQAGNYNANPTDAYYATVGGGFGNTASGLFTTVGGGFSNTASGFYSTMGGGFQNAANDSATVAGGNGNTASGAGAAVGGGIQNTASGYAATVPGGDYNVAAGWFSFAAGNRARADHHGAFVWADNTGTDFASTAAKQFLVRASGGVGINTNAPNSLLAVQGSAAGARLQVGGVGGDAHHLSSGRDVVFNATGGLFSFRSVSDINNLTSYTEQFIINSNGSANLRGMLTQNSDARFKHDIATLPNALDTLNNLRGVSYLWNDATRGTGRQIGFIAQEVEKVLPELVTTDSNGYKSVAYANVVPVLVEAIKTQQKQREADQAEVKTLKAENAELRAELNAIKAAIRQIQKERQ